MTVTMNYLLMYVYAHANTHECMDLPGEKELSSAAQRYNEQHYS